MPAITSIARADPPGEDNDDDGVERIEMRFDEFRMLLQAVQDDLETLMALLTIRERLQ